MLLRIRLGSHVHEVPDLRRVDLLILGSDEHSGNTGELIVGPLQLLDLSVAVHEVHCEEESFWPQLKLTVHLAQPSDHHLPHLESEILLVSHACCSWLV